MRQTFARKRQGLNQELTPGAAYLALTFTALFLATNHIIGRGVHGEVPPIGLSFWRWVAGVLILLPFAIPGMRRHVSLMRRHWRDFALLGFFMVGSTTLVLVALNHTFAINVSLINAVQPTLTVFFAWLLFAEPLSRTRALGVVLGFSGVLVMVSRADPAVLLALNFRGGDFITLLAMCGFAGYALNLGKLPREMGIVTGLFGISLCGTIMLLPVYLWETLAVEPVPFNATSVAAILALALLVTVLANLCWFAGNRVIGPSRASIFINLIPVFGSALAIAFLGEQLLAYHVAGGLMVIGGLVLAAGIGRWRRPWP